MTYFYAQLFTMDAEIRAMFPAAMDLQRRRFFEALGRIAAAQQSQAADLPSWPAHQRPDAALAAAGRTYSIANAPRPDGLIRLHVRAISGGLVSPHSLRPGPEDSSKPEG